MFHGASVNILLFTPIRKTCSSLRGFSRKSNCTTELLGRSLYVIQTRQEIWITEIVTVTGTVCTTLSFFEDILCRTAPIFMTITKEFNPLKTKLNLLHISNQSVPRCKHFPPRL
jgi:hypothetical protein